LQKKRKKQLPQAHATKNMVKSKTNSKRKSKGARFVTAKVQREPPLKLLQDRVATAFSTAPFAPVENGKEFFIGGITSFENRSYAYISLF
jgi:hypothetical protein